MSRLIVSNIETQNIKFDSDTTAFTINSSGVLNTSSIIVKGEGSATTNLQQGLAKSWINFNGTGTIAVRDSFNVSSITDGATGDHLVHYSSNIANENYTSSINTGGAGVLIASGRSGQTYNKVSYIRIGIREGNSQAWTDTDFVGVTIHGDLA